MKIIFSLGYIIGSILFPENITAQSTTLYNSLTYPRSIISSGIGEQGAATMNVSDAMQYNPANLVYTGSASVSFFRNLMMANYARMPITSTAMSLKISDAASVGLEYVGWEMGSLPLSTAEQPEGNGEFFHLYERSVAGAAAVVLGKGWSVGAQVRYAWSSVVDDAQGHVLVGVGTSYVPEALSRRAVFGLSLMSFSNPISQGFEIIQTSPTIYTTPSNPTPAQINFAVDYSLISQPSVDVMLSLGFTKPLDKMEDENLYVAQSSLTSLFTDWNDFPQDVTTHIGLGYLWKPLPLGGGVSYFQEMYAGYFTVGPSSWPPDGIFLRTSPYISYFTHGVRAGIEINGVRLTAGYAGRWHDNVAHSSVQVTPFPNTTFQFTLSTDKNILAGTENTAQEMQGLRSVVVTAGYAYGAPIGRMKGAVVYGSTDAYDVRSLWSSEAAFYLNDNSALTASLGYARMHESYTPVNPSSYGLEFDADIETVTLESGWRYHPVESFHPFFVQASLGIMWLNPLSPIFGPRYFYTGFDNLSIGCVIPVSETKFIIIPKAGLKTMFLNAFPYSEKLAGYNQFEFGVNIGCSL